MHGRHGVACYRGRGGVDERCGVVGDNGQSGVARWYDPTATGCFALSLIMLFLFDFFFFFAPKTEGQRDKNGVWNTAKGKVDPCNYRKRGKIGPVQL